MGVGGEGESPGIQTSREKATAMSQSLLTAALALLAGLLGFLWRGYSKATSKANALAEVVRQNKARATEEHTETMETIDAKEAQLDNADSPSLASDLDALFSGGVSVSQDGADGGGSDGPL